MRGLLIPLIILFTNPILASDYKISENECSHVDVRDNKPLSVRQHLSQPIDQKDSNWCYGFVAADLLSIEAGEVLSRAHVSAIYNKSIRSNLFWKFGYNITRLISKQEIYQSGFVSKAVNEAMKVSPICLQNNLDEDIDVIKKIQVLKTLAQNKMIEYDEVCSNLEQYLPGIDVSTNRFMTDFISNDLNDQLEGLIRQSCRDAVEVPKKEMKEFYKPIFWGKKDHAKRVNDLLSRGKALATSYKASTISDQVTGSFHSSTVIGRRWKNGRCEYNVRNTWGRLCVYKPHVECNQDDGSYWVNDEDFFKMSLTINYLD